jgi:hypothetical protein
VGFLPYFVAKLQVKKNGTLALGFRRGPSSFLECRVVGFVAVRRDADDVAHTLDK